MKLRVYRYDKPARAVMLDILNSTNKTLYEPDQIEFLDPVAMDDATYTRVVVKPTDRVKWTEEVPLYYHRLDLAATFKNNPLVIDVLGLDALSVQTALREQFNLYFDLDQVSITTETTSLSSAFPRQTLFGFEAESVAPDDQQPEVPGFPQVATLTLKALSTSLLWVGEITILARNMVTLMERSISQRLKVREYFHETLEDKIAVELLVPRYLNASDYSTTLRRLKKDEYLSEHSDFVGIARALTKDEWVAVDYKENFNLYGAKVLYNGFNRDEFFNGFARMSHVLALQLPSQCANLAGIWLVGYNDREAFQYTPFRVDGGPYLV